MRIQIVHKNAQIDDNLRDYINKRVLKLNNFASNIVSARVILEEIRHSRIAEIVVHMKRTQLVAKDDSPDFYASVDNAAQGLAKQLRRHTDRIRTRRRRFAVARIRRRFKEAFEF